jgi:hypothetical protein
LFPGHESGVGSSPTLISIRLAPVRYPRIFFGVLVGVLVVVGDVVSSGRGTKLTIPFEPRPSFLLSFSHSLRTLRPDIVSS